MTNYLRAVLIVAAVTIAAVLLTFAHANASPVCMSWKTGSDQARKNYGEIASYVATTTGGAVIIVTVNLKTGTWTLWAMPTPDQACPISFGDGWEAAPDSVANPLGPSY